MRVPFLRPPSPFIFFPSPFYLVLSSLPLPPLSSLLPPPPSSSPIIFFSFLFNPPSCLTPLPSYLLPSSSPVLRSVALFCSRSSSLHPLSFLSPQNLPVLPLPPCLFPLPSSLFPSPCSLPPSPLRPPAFSLPCPSSFPPPLPPLLPPVCFVSPQSFSLLLIFSFLRPHPSVSFLPPSCLRVIGPRQGKPSATTAIGPAPGGLPPPCSGWNTWKRKIHPRFLPGRHGLVICLQYTYLVERYLTQLYQEL